MAKTEKNTATVPARRVGIARALSKMGIASRTVAALWINEGRVALNGRIVRDPETPVFLSRDSVSVDGRIVLHTDKRYLMLNKPRGLITSARDEQGRDTIYSCFTQAEDKALKPVGRLDKASEGLLLFTNDTEWASRVLSPESNVVKIYHVQINSRVGASIIAVLHEGVATDAGVLKAEKAELLREGVKNCWLAITLCEGKNRQIRKMFQALDMEVMRLIRVAIGPIKLDDLTKGQYRELSNEELVALSKML